MAGRLDGRIAIVTGGTRGIGEAIATALLADGATVVVSSRKPAGVADAVARLEAAAPGRVHGVPCNMGRLEQVHTLYDAAVEVAAEERLAVRMAGQAEHVVLVSRQLAERLAVVARPNPQHVVVAGGD